MSEDIWDGRIRPDPTRDGDERTMEDKTLSAGCYIYAFAPLIIGLIGYLVGGCNGT